MTQPAIVIIEDTLKMLTMLLSVRKDRLEFGPAFDAHFGIISTVIFDYTYFERRLFSVSVIFDNGNFCTQYILKLGGLVLY